jgi:hypothetical protein
MSNMEFALAAVSVVVVGVALFSAVWYRVEKLQAEQKRKNEFSGTWEFMNRPFMPSGRIVQNPFVVGHDLVTTDREK